MASRQKLEISSVQSQFSRSKINLIFLKMIFLFEYQINRRNFSKRICIGTDFPEFNYHSVKKSLSYLNIDIYNAIDNGVLGGNLVKFLDLN